MKKLAVSSCAHFRNILSEIFRSKFFDLRLGTYAMEGSGKMLVTAVGVNSQTGSAFSSSLTTLSPRVLS